MLNGWDIIQFAVYFSLINLINLYFTSFVIAKFYDEINIIKFVCHLYLQADPAAWPGSNPSIPQICRQL